AGVPTRFAVVGYDPAGTGFDHVYAEVDLSDDPDAPRWIAADPTLDAPLGTATRAPRRRTHTPDDLLKPTTIMGSLLRSLGNPARPGLGCGCSTKDPRAASLGCPGCGGACDG